MPLISKFVDLFVQEVINDNLGYGWCYWDHVMWLYDHLSFCFWRLVNYWDLILQALLSACQKAQKKNVFASSQRQPPLLCLGRNLQGFKKRNHRFDLNPSSIFDFWLNLLHFSAWVNWVLWFLEKGWWYVFDEKESSFLYYQNRCKWNKATCLSGCPSPVFNQTINRGIK